MPLTIIAAMSENRVIGRAGDLPWRLPDDFKRFKRLTRGHHVVMGRKTFESLPGGALTDRVNLVITRQKFEEVTDHLVKRTIEIADMVVKDAGLGVHQLDEILLVGGQTRWPAVQKAVQEYFGKPPAKVRS